MTTAVGAPRKVAKGAVTGRGEPRSRRNERAWTPWAFLAPFLVLFGLFVLLPALAGVLISFTEWSIVGTALRNTGYFVVMAVPLLVLALGLAMLLNTGRWGVKLVRSLVYLPIVLMVIIVTTLWKWLLDSKFGLIDHYLRQIFGMDPIAWLVDSRWAMPAIVITTVWWTVGSNMVIYLAALQDIPSELYEAAEIDGAGAWPRFRSVTWPMLSNVNALVIPFTFIGSWQVFGQVYLMTGGGRAPRRS
ncbi:MAG: sugar ABC transporter permease [Nonomuraea sp.]|nr:sugar ABC transporter permease [Nonomuraea sp.]